jgi:hypothetical protein
MTYVPPVPDEVVLAHAPRLILHPLEPCAPSDPGAFFADRDVHHVEKTGLFKTRTNDITLGQAADLVAGKFSAGADEGRLYLAEGAAPPGDDPPGPGHVDVAPPLICETTALPGGDSAVTYWFFHADDSAFGRRRFKFSAHQGDWERLVLRFGPTFEPKYAAYHQHESYDKLAWADIPKVERGSSHPVVYSARGSHASYAKPGRQKRPWDMCAQQNPQPGQRALDLWVAGEVVHCEAQAWYRLGVRWGADSGTLPFGGASPFGPGNRTGCPARWFTPGADPLD